MSKYPIELIQTDFVENRLKYRELEAKYGIPQQMLAYYSKKYNWSNKREEFQSKIRENTQKLSAEQRAKEEFNFIEALKKLASMKIRAEAESFLDALDKTTKEKLFAISKTSPLPELLKIIRLLEGATTQNIQFTEEEKQYRVNRLRYLLGQ